MGHRISLDVEHEPAVQKYVTAILRRGHFQAVEAEDGALEGANHGLDKSPFGPSLGA